MTLLQPRRTASTFGLGGDEPYARALRRNTAAPSGRLALHEIDAEASAPRVVMDFDKWDAVADETDRELLTHVLGPVLDIGCGPGRMVRAAVELGLEALGLDVSAEAVAYARASGLAVIEGSVFDRMLAEGAWQTALLVDGNVGIGGDVPALLARCRQLLRASGELIVELHRDERYDHSYLAALVDDDGARSGTFPWAEVGLDRVLDLAPGAGFTPVESWTAAGRSFCRLACA